jgi:hypothetical protein
MANFTIDTDTVDPDHLEQLAAFIRRQRERRLERLMSMVDRPALGAYRGRHPRLRPQTESAR